MKVSICILASLAVVSAGGNGGYLPGGRVGGLGGASTAIFGAGYGGGQAHRGGVSHVSRTFAPAVSYGGRGYGYGGAESGNVWGAGTPSSYEYTVHHGSSNSGSGYGRNAVGSDAVWAGNTGGYGGGRSAGWNGGYSGWQ